MSATTAELIIDDVVEALAMLNGSSPYDTDLRGRVFAVDPVYEVSMQTTPVVLVSFDGIDPGQGLRQRVLGVSIDVYVDADYATQRGVPTKSLLLRIESDIQLAMAAVKYTMARLARQTFLGARTHGVEDGSTRNGLTIRYAVGFAEERVG